MKNRKTPLWLRLLSRMVKPVKNPKITAVPQKICLICTITRKPDLMALRAVRREYCRRKRSIHITCYVDSALIPGYDWKTIAASVWKAPEEITSNLIG